jgi:multidrug resistance efflux pump
MTISRALSRLWVVGLALLLATGIGATLVLRLRAGDGPPKDSNTLPAATAPTEGAVCIGHVDVEQRVQCLYPVQPGRVEEVLVREDEPVQAGAVLFRLDEQPAQFVVRLAQTDLKAAQLRLDQARKLPQQHQLQIAQQQQAIEAAQHRAAAARLLVTRHRNLERPKEEIDAAAEQVKEAEAAAIAAQKKLEELKLLDPATEVARAEEEVKAKQIHLEQAQFALSECSVRAPVAGKVLRLFVSKGDLLSAEPKQPAVQFCPDGPRVVRAEVEQEFAGRVAKGQIAEVRDDSRTGPVWRGKVTHVSDWYTHRRSILQEPLQFNDVRTLECIIQLDPHPQLPRIGQRVRVALGPVSGT